MLRDSVDNPKALLAEFGKLMKNKKLKAERKNRSRNLRELKPGDLRSGEKIDQIEVDWTSTRRRDVPAIPEFDGNSKYDKPMLAGQLLIFDLDEEPPNDVGLDKNSTKDASTACSVTKDGLLAIFAGFGAILAALISAIGFLIIRLKSQTTPIDQATPIFNQYARKRFFESAS
ncbi:ZP domain-containing protein [Caenorhabditis elegans]|nr:ZP domain-containing protein [Caenorhabditis elegans]CBZ01796.1 ZP domain-containing protein [Caenorhabditis elegans]|eukprot:NP_001250722.1 CUTiclin-Like [Caenorhabditis elegans]